MVVTEVVEIVEEVIVAVRVAVVEIVISGSRS